MNYTNVQHVMDIIESTDGILKILPPVLEGFVSHTSSINPDGDIEFGQVNTSDISFSVLSIRGSVNAYTGREVRYKKAYAEQSAQERLVTPCSVYLASSDILVWAEGSTLTVSAQGQSETYSMGETVGALTLDNGELSVLFPVEPYIKQYTVNGIKLTEKTVENVTQYEKDLAALYARRQESYVSANNSITAFGVFYVSGTRYLSTKVYEVHDKGVFVLNRPKRGTGGVFSITASDKMYLFEQDSMDAVKTIGENTTAAQLLSTLCRLRGVSLKPQTYINPNQVVRVSEDLETVTGTQLLQWLGEILGCSWRIDTAGQLEGVWYTESDTLLTKDDYVSFSYDTFTVDPVDKVLVGSAYAERTGLAGTGANALVVSGNTLLPLTEESALNTFAQSLLNRAKTIPEYRAGTLNGYANPTIQPGQVISVINDDDETDKVCVTQMQETGFVLNIVSSGNERRDAQSYMNVTLQSVKQAVADLEKQTSEFPQQWEEAISETVKEITGGMGGTRVDLFDPDTGKPSGTAYLMDSADINTAKDVLVINAGGIAFYDNGFNVENPSASVPSFVVMNNKGQVNASSILTGVLTAILLRSADGSFNINLEDGYLRTESDRFSIYMSSIGLFIRQSLDEGNLYKGGLYVSSKETGNLTVSDFSMYGLHEKEAGTDPGEKSRVVLFRDSENTACLSVDKIMDKPVMLTGTVIRDSAEFKDTNNTVVLSINGNTIYGYGRSIIQALGTENTRCWFSEIWGLDKLNGISGLQWTTIPDAPGRYFLSAPIAQPSSFSGLDGIAFTAPTSTEPEKPLTIKDIR